MAANGAETFKSTVEQFTTAGNQAFKDSIEKSLSARGEVNANSKKNLEAVVASVTAATKGAEALGAQARAYSKKALEDQVAAAKSLTSAKSVQEVVELQTAYAKSALEAYIAQVTKASETVSASVKESFQPINERVTAFVEKIQGAHQAASSFRFSRERGRAPLSGRVCLIGRRARLCARCAGAVSQRPCPHPKTASHPLA